MARIVHGKTNTPEWHSWRAMIKRCRQPTDRCYHLYGGAGIMVCDRWNIFTNFLNDMGMRPVGMTLERVNRLGNYQPDNCKWATKIEQGRNKRNNNVQTAFGATACLTELCEKFGKTYNLIKNRLRYGWKLEKALAKPIAKRLSKDEKQAIKRLAKTVSKSELARQFGITWGAVHYVIHH